MWPYPVEKENRWQFHLPKVGDLQNLAAQESTKDSASARQRPRSSTERPHRIFASAVGIKGSALTAVAPRSSQGTWGSPGVGADSSVVQDQLRSVQQVRATWWAFAAILADGSVVTWGEPTVQDELKSVSGHGVCLCCDPSRWICRCVGRSICWWWYLCSPREAQECATGSGRTTWWLCCTPSRQICYYLGWRSPRWWQFQSPKAAEECEADSGHGSVVTWGDPGSGGDCSAVQDELQLL